jgi:hypothetical protein
MRKITLAVAAASVGLLAASAPAFAYTTYQIQTAETAAALNDNANADQQKSSGFSMTTQTNVSDPAAPYGSPAAARLAQPQQQNLSGDMTWQGTGYYLRGNN